ncbi:efflux RND transporter periplasmic adaptor subunit [Noviherbaspirillum sp. Root189]|uniref:efflux RND transporter periplasmic adaptor subunit n=1 Tax=Noviherbaspirillum sp. Root189 TaxID=1736487 RepID=UPI0009E93EEA|nr:efflux RND transporter periplasmic adaptor subunit [Noviherbaspirillum sp. Root189]
MNFQHVQSPVGSALFDLNDSFIRNSRAWIAITILVLLLCACNSKEQGGAPVAKAPPDVGVVVMQAQSQQLETVLPGRTRSYLAAEVRPQVSGIIQKRLFFEGDMVRQSQPLYQLDPGLLRAAEASAVAALAKAEASQRTLDATVRRNAELVKIDAISKQEYEESQAAAIQAKADVGMARANLETARINLRYSRIEAPISGRVSLSTVTPGALVTANQATPLTTIVQLDPMYVDFTQSSSELIQLKRDWKAGRYQKVDADLMKVRIRMEDGTEYPHEAKLRFAGVIVNETTGTVTLRAEVANPEGILMPGMYVQAQLPTGLASDALLIPQQAITRDPAGRASVMVVKQDSTIEKRNIEVARAIGNKWLLDSGVRTGEKVVVDGFQRIKPGDKVTVRIVEMNDKANVSAGGISERDNKKQAASAQGPGANASIYK